MRVLGLDPGSRRTGFGVVERSGNRYRCLALGVATAPARMDLAHRLHAIATRAAEVMDEWKPDAVAVEEAFYHESVRSTLVLGHVRGALLVAAVARGIAVAEYTPRAIKLGVTGSGGATKVQVSHMIRHLLGVKGTVSADATDALAVAVCHLHRTRLTAPARPAGAVANRLEALLARKAR